MNDEEAFKRREMCVVCGACACHEGGRISGDRVAEEAAKSLTSLEWLKIQQVTLELLVCLLCSSLKFIVKDQGLH